MEEDPGQEPAWAIKEWQAKESTECDQGNGMDERENHTEGNPMFWEFVDSYIGCVCVLGGGSSRLKTEHCPLGLMAKQLFVPFAGGHYPVHGMCWPRRAEWKQK